MNKIYGLFVILGVLGEFAFCQQFNPLPNENQNIDHSRILFTSLFDNPIPIQTRSDTPTNAAHTRGLPRTLFGNLFDKVISNEARNDTPTTAAPTTTTSKPAQSTTEAVLIIPVFEEPIYEPNFYPIPPYPELYNAPIPDWRVLLDNFEPNYPLINSLPSFYAQSEELRKPSFNPSLSQLFGSQPLLQPTNVNPSIGIVNLPYFNPNSINAATESPNAIPQPTIVKPSIITNSLGNRNLDEMTDMDRHNLSKEMQKLIVDFIMKKHKEMIESVDSGEINYRPLSPWSSTFAPPISTNSAIPVVENVVEHYEQPKPTSNLHIKIPLDVESNSNSSSHYRQEPKINETMQSPIEMNQSGNSTAPQNETDAPRILDEGFDEEEISTIATTDASSTISSKDSIELLKTNQTSVNGSKVNNRFIDQSITHVPILPKFVDVDGKNCSMAVGKYQGEYHPIIICAEESFDGKKNQRTTTTLSNVTFYTDELPTTTTESTKQISNKTINKSSGLSDYEVIDTLPPNAESNNTKVKLIPEFKKGNGEFNESAKNDSRPYEHETIATASTTTTELTTRVTTEHPKPSYDFNEYDEDTKSPVSFEKKVFSFLT